MTAVRPDVPAGPVLARAGDDDGAVTTLEPGGPNAIARAMGVVGDEWNLQVLRRAFFGARRFRDFRSALGISDAVLSDRLAGLVDQGLLERVGSPARPTYDLTARGRSAWQVLVAIWSWEQDWVERPEPLPRLVHATCGRPTSADLACGACGELAPVGSFRARLGPSGDWHRAVPESTTRRRRRPRGEFPETMALLGDRWSAVVLGGCLMGIRRFTTFRDALGIPPNTLSDRLSRFVEVGVLRATDEGYRLTAKGRAFAPVTGSAIAWGQRWWVAPEGPALVVEHAGHDMPVRLGCRACGGLLHAAEVLVEPVEG